MILSMVAQLWWEGELKTHTHWFWGQNVWNPNQPQVYVMWLHLLFNSVLPFTALLYLNAAIYKRLVSVIVMAVMMKETTLMIF